MAKILVFNNDTNRMETYYRGKAEPMPYNTNGTLRVREFRGSSKSNILWTTKRCMQSWNSQRYIYGRPIPDVSEIVILSPLTNVGTLLKNNLFL